MKTKTLMLILALLLIGGAAFTASAQDSACPNGRGAGEGGKCLVVLVNSFLGNDYRIQMQRAATAAASHAPYSDIIDFQVLNTDNTPEAQRAGIQNLLLNGVDAILLDAVDNTSVNDLVEQACDDGVVVVTFDITARPGSCEYAVEFAFGPWSMDAGRWLAAATGAADHPINVIMDRGLQGVDIANTIYQSGLDGMKEVAGEDNINIVGEYYGEFAEGVQEPLISAILAANPDTKIDVVFTQGYCTTVISAFKNAGADYLPAMYCQAYNANGLACVENNAVCFINQNTNAGSIGSLDIAYRALTGETDIPKETQWSTAYAVTGEADIQLEVIQPVPAEIGVNVFPELPPGFQPLYNWPGALVQISLAEATGIEGLGEATPEATASS